MKTNVFLKQVAFASFVIAQTLASAWASNPNLETEEGPFVSVPRDAQLHTCAYLDTKALVNTSRVSKGLEILCNEDRLWAERTPGAKTKKDVVTIFTTPMMKYPAKALGSFEISCNDVMTFLKTARFIVGDTTYTCKIPQYSFTQKQELLHFLKGSCHLFLGLKFSIHLQEDGNAILLNGDICAPRKVYFERQKIETNLCSFVAPEQVPTQVMTQEDLAMWVMNVLYTLDSNYKDARFGPFWGRNYAFDYLLDMLPRLTGCKDLPLETKQQIAQFFIHKYVDYTKIENSSISDDHKACEYTWRLKSTIEKELEIDCAFPAYYRSPYPRG
jgi:hypothetical protein